MWGAVGTREERKVAEWKESYCQKTRLGKDLYYASANGNAQDEVGERGWETLERRLEGRGRVHSLQSIWEESGGYYSLRKTLNSLDERGEGLL